MLASVTLFEGSRFRWSKGFATLTASVVAIGCCRLDNVHNDGHRHESRSPSVRPQAGFSVLSIAIEHAQVRFEPCRDGLEHLFPTQVYGPGSFAYHLDN